MNSIIDSFLTIREKFQSFNNSLVISVSLFLIIMVVVIAVENIFYKLENKLFVLDGTDYLIIKLLIWFVELIAVNLIFFSLGSFLFSNISNSYYTFYQIVFVFNLIVTLLRFFLKLYYSVKAES